MTLAWQGPMVPPSISNPRSPGAKRAVSASEESWLQMKPIFSSPVKDHERPPVGTAPTLEGLGAFLNRVTEIEAIANTQFLELPTVSQELAQTGIGSFSISSSSDEDDESFDVSDTDLERNACRYGTAYLTQELAPIVRRIEWERYVFHCGPSQRVALAVVNGALSAVSESKALSPEEVASLGKRIWLAAGKPDAATLLNDQARAAHYGVVGSILYGVTKGSHIPEQSFDMLGASDQEEDQPDGGPSELGLHNVEQGTVLFEPTDAELWPDEYQDLSDEG